MPRDGHPTHGMSKTRTYKAWKGMRDRCRNQNSREYKHYGARGIKIVSRWERFENFLADLGEVPPGYSLERKDVNKNYGPTNCLWIPRTKQSRNRRDSVRIVHQGVSRPLVEWCELLGVSYNAARARYLRGFPVERILASGDLRAGRTMPSRKLKTR